jgi:hypothetical protein
MVEHQMRRQLLEYSALHLMFLVVTVQCETGLDERIGVVTARDLSGTYTGVLEGVTVSDLDGLEDPHRRVIVDLDLLHELTIREVGKLTLRMESSIVPPLRAFVLGIGPAAINVEFVEFEGLGHADRDPPFEALKVKQIVFVRYEGEWVLVLQLVRVDTEAQETVDGVYVYQYVSYPSRVADRLSEQEAIQYVNTILRLVSAAQRSWSH